VGLVVAAATGAGAVVEAGLAEEGAGGGEGVLD